MTNTTSTYIPGVCNIGKAEIKYRRTSGIVGVVATIVFWVLFALLHVPHGWRVILFLPATLAALGFMQAWLHFCVKYGTSGLFNVSDTMAKQETVDQQEFRKKDQQKSVIIIVGSVVFGLIVALAVFYL